MDIEDEIAAQIEKLRSEKFSDEDLTAIAGRCHRLLERRRRAGDSDEALQKLFHDFFQDVSKRPAETFRKNLHGLAKSKGCLTENELAKRLGWVTAKKRWLRRLWKDGLRRHNSKTQADLSQLSKFFGLTFGELWDSKLTIPTEVEVSLDDAIDREIKDLRERIDGLIEYKMRIIRSLIEKKAVGNTT